MTEKTEEQVQNSAKFALILAFVCLGLFGLGGKLGLDLVNMLNNGVEVSGIVVDHQARKSSEMNETYSLIVEFVDQNGGKNKFTDGTSSYPPSHEVGDEVAVLYMAGNPSDAMVNRGAVSWILPLAFFGIGGLGLFFFTMQYMKARRKRF